MQCNLGKTDRILRAVAGVAIIGWGVMAQNWLGAIGLVPLLTACVGFCPAYVPFKLNTGGKCCGSCGCGTPKEAQ